MLNKTEKSKVTARILAVKCEELAVNCLAGTARKLKLVSDSLKLLYESLAASFLLFMTKHLLESFVRIYKCSTIIKERYLQFQLWWHSYCSYSLVSKNMELSDIGLHPSDPLTGPVVSIRSQWNKVCHTYSIDDDTARTFLISYFGFVVKNFQQDLVQKNYFVIWLQFFLFLLYYPSSSPSNIYLLLSVFCYSLSSSESREIL